MAKKIQVIVDVESNSVKVASDETLTLTQQVRALRMELQKTPEGTKEFNLLVTKLNDTQDALGRVSIKGKELFGTLGLIPGPIGEIAARTNSAVDALKVFGKLKTSDLQAQFKALKDDFSEVGGAVFKLTGLKKLYVTTLRSASQGLQAMGISIKGASTAAKAFAVTMTALTAATGLILITTLIGQLSEAYEYLSTKTERADAAQKKLNETLLKGAKVALDAESESIKRSGDLLLAQARARGDSADKIYKIEQDNRKLLLESQQRYYKELKNKDSDEAIAAEKAIKDTQSSIKIAEADFQTEQLKNKQESSQKLTDKEQARVDKEKQIRDQALAAISKGEVDAFKATLTARELEEYEINQKYAVLIADATKYNRDKTLLETGLQAELKTMRDKFTKEDTDDAKKKTEDDLKLIQDDNNRKLQAESVAAQLKFAQGLQTEEEYEAALYQIKLKYANTDQERQQAEIDFLDFKKDKQKEYEDAVKETNKAVAESYINLASSIGTSFLEISKIFEQGSDLQKTFAIISVLINAAAAVGKVVLDTQEAISSARKTIVIGTDAVAQGTAILPLNPIVGGALIGAGTATAAKGKASLGKALLGKGIQIGTITAAAATQIAAITASGKSKSASGSRSSGGSQGATPEFSGTVSVPAPVIGASQASQSGTLGQTIAGAVMEGNSKSRPIQAYVVGDQVSTQQQLDRRISVAAKMAG